MTVETDNKPARPAEAAPAGESPADETELAAQPGWREVFRQAFDKARREQRAANRRDLGRDRSRSLFLLGGAALALLLLFFGVFSSSSPSKKAVEMKRAGTPGLGRKITPGRETTPQEESPTPLLSAQTGAQEFQGSQDVTPEEVSRTAHPAEAFPRAPARFSPNSAASTAGPYALGKIDFSDPAARERAPGASASRTILEADELKRPSLVFTRSVQSNSAGSTARIAPVALEEGPPVSGLPAGTKLAARLQTVVSSAVKAPVVAAIEYSYEESGQIVVPAGARVFGSLEQVNRSGYVAIHFDTLQLPDGATEKIEAGAMSLTYELLKGNVGGRKIGTRFLVRTLTGLGTLATYLVGSGGTNGLNGPLSESALLRERLATSVGTAGNQELNTLALNENIVVTIPANTRFYVVVENSGAVRHEEVRPAEIRQASYAQPPTVQELRALMQLRQELGEMTEQPAAEKPLESAPQQ